MCKFERYRQIGLADFNQPHLQYIRRDRKYLDEFLEKECELTPKQAARLAVIAMNVDRIYRSLLRVFFDMRPFQVFNVYTKLETVSMSAI